MYSGIREFTAAPPPINYSRTRVTDYDATALSPAPSAPTEFHQTLFPVSSDGILKAAEKLAAVRRAKRAFTVGLMLREASLVSQSFVLLEYCYFRFALPGECD